MTSRQYARREKSVAYIKNSALIMFTLAEFRMTARQSADLRIRF